MINKKTLEKSFVHATMAGFVFMLGASICMYGLDNSDMYNTAFGFFVLVYSIYFYYKAQQIERAIDELVEVTKTNR